MPSPIDDTAPASPPLRVGDTVGRYRIEARIGGGGMGVVWRATDTTLGRAVALKFLAADLAGTGEARARFLREARAASGLDHPNIGVVYEVGEHAGAAFIAMAFYDGETLRERIARGPLPIADVVELTRQLAAALQAAHAAGIAHRDVKPANIIVTRDGTLKLVDFGLAKLLDDATGEALTASGALLGTLSYMAPEQLRGADVDARADLWALGAVAYEMLAGRPPFVGPQRAAVITAILTSEPPNLGGVRKETPPPLLALIRSLLVKSPEERLPSATQALAMLDDKASTTWRARSRSSPREVRWAWLLVALVVAAAGVTAWRLWPTNQDRARAEYQRGQREFDLAHYDSAQAHFEEVYRLTGDPALLYNVAQMYRLGGHNGHAVTLFRRYLATGPSPERRADVEEKLRVLEQPPLPPPVATPTPPVPPDLKGAGLQAFERGLRNFELMRWDEAQRDFEAAYVASGQPQILFNVAQMYRRQGQAKNAAALYRRFLEKLPNAPNRALVEGWIRDGEK